MYILDVKSMIEQRDSINNYHGGKITNYDRTKPTI